MVRTPNKDDLVPPNKPKLLERVRAKIRTKGLSYDTEKSYIHWIKRFILFHNKQYPGTLGSEAISEFLTHLAVDRNVAASTQNQALNALMFLYKQELGIDPGKLADIERAKEPKRIPVIFSRREIAGILSHLRGKKYIVAVLLYGSGLRLRECLRLRVKDIDFERNQIFVRAGKGKKIE